MVENGVDGVDGVDAWVSVRMHGCVVAQQPATDACSQWNKAGNRTMSVSVAVAVFAVAHHSIPTHALV